MDILTTSVLVGSCTLQRNSTVYMCFVDDREKCDYWLVQYQRLLDKKPQALIDKVGCVSVCVCVCMRVCVRGVYHVSVCMCVCLCECVCVSVCVCL